MVEYFRLGDKVHFEKQYRKKPIIIQAIQVFDDFIVSTKEGEMHGKEGDYLIQGIKGELYPCAKEIFEETYEWVENG